MAGIRDVAELAGVSISTVSSVLNNSKPVSRKLEERVMRAAEVLEYQPHPLARSLRSSKTGLVGVVMSLITSSFFPQILKGIEDVAYRQGYSLMFYDASRDVDREEQYVRLLDKYATEGLIIDSIASFEERAEYRRFVESRLLSQRRMPVVSIERPLWSNSPVSAVGVDNVRGGYIATRHLLDLGHTRILHIAGPGEFPVAEDRIIGYRRALDEAGVAFDESLITRGDFTPMSGYSSVKHMLNAGRTFTAIFAANDQMSVGAIKALKEEAIAIPDEVAVIGFDNLPMGTFIDPPLSTVDVPKYRLGASAMELLVSHLRSGSLEPAFEEVPIRLIPRRSTDRSAESSWELFGW